MRMRFRGSPQQQHMQLSAAEQQQQQQQVSSLTVPLAHSEEDPAQPKTTSFLPRSLRFNWTRYHSTGVLLHPHTTIPESLYQCLSSAPPDTAFAFHNNTHHLPGFHSTNIMATTTTSSSSTTDKPIIPKFDFREITLGLLVGQGGFSDVRDIVGIDIDESFNTSDQETAIRKEIAISVNNKNGFKDNLVLKTLRNDLPEDEHTKGVLDLAIEAEFLAQLSHPHIISLRATATTDPHDDRFFVILDRLGITLERKFNQWRGIASESSGIYVPCYGYCCAKTPILHALWKERLLVAWQTASALEHLHAHGIVYRDLKPDNIGLDTDRNVRLFDFGLAKRVADAERAPDNGNPAFAGLYHLTGNTGSLRYMAPEVAQCLPYDHTVDAYSFGILFWQICSLTTPYAKYSTRMHADRVVRQGHRPKPDPSWPPTWIQLQQACWSADRSFRPAFTHIVATLQEQLDMLEEDGVIPSRALEIRAKKKKKQVKSDQLDRDTRLPSDEGTQKRYESDVV